ncbi:MAG: 2'-deoxycytidine 5'-triphosphate deaminase [Alphaproteobacteria bacterium]|nr:2'-deoxycytidine 5'-triphosphate deaminase [Alphaproteobacteria bacterium]MDD9919259.1 2'-deoxycytidine 5'-triphosphate deaminase [Alphaproteobacteria bacterium]
MSNNEWAMGLSHGVLPRQDIQEMVAKGILTPDTPLEDGQIQPASIDVRVGQRVHRLRTSFLPRQGERVQDTLEKYSLYSFNVDDAEGAILEVGCTYLVEVQEKLDLPQAICGTASPKSTTGRLDIFCRIFTENAARFDAIEAGYSGPVYLEITPMSFPIVLRTGDRLLQLRFRVGQSAEVDLVNTELNWDSGLLFDSEHQPIEATIMDGLWLSLGLKPTADGAPIAYRAKRNTPVVDLRKIGEYSTHDYWDIVEPEDESLVLYPGEFYILGSAEKLCVPPTLSAEMVPFDITFGEVRVHYAGFFDPGFGVVNGKGVGTRAVLEVRNHGAPFRVTHGQKIARMKYEALSKTPDILYGAEIQSNYAGQEVKLAKQFGMAA